MSKTNTLFTNTESPHLNTENVSEILTGIDKTYSTKISALSEPERQQFLNSIENWAGRYEESYGLSRTVGMTRGASMDGNEGNR